MSSKSKRNRQKKQARKVANLQNRVRDVQTRHNVATNAQVLELRQEIADLKTLLANNETNGAAVADKSATIDWMVTALVGAALIASNPVFSSIAVGTYLCGTAYKHRHSIVSKLGKGTAIVKGLFSPAAKALTAGKDSAKIHLANAQYTASNAKNAAVGMAIGSGSKAVNKLGEIKANWTAKREAKKAEEEAAAATVETASEAPEASEETTTSKPGQAKAFLASTVSSKTTKVVAFGAAAIAAGALTAVGLVQSRLAASGLSHMANGFSAIDRYMSSSAQPVVAGATNFASSPWMIGGFATVAGVAVIAGATHLLHKKIGSKPTVKLVAANDDATTAKPSSQNPEPKAEKKPSSILTKMKSPWTKRIAATAVTVGLVTVASLGYIQCSPKGDNDQKLKVTANTPKVESVAPAVNTTDAELAAREAKLAKLPETQSTVDTKTETADTAQVKAEKSDAGKKVAAEVKKSSDNKAKAKKTKTVAKASKGKKAAGKKVAVGKVDANKNAAAESARLAREALAKAKGTATAKKAPTAAVSGTTAHLVDLSEANPMEKTYVGVKETAESPFNGVADNGLNPAHQAPKEGVKTADAAKNASDTAAKADTKVEAKNEKGGLLGWFFGKSAKETTEKKVADKGNGYTSWLDRYFGEKAKAEAAAAEAAKSNPTKASEKSADGENKVAAAKVVAGKVNKEELRKNFFVDGHNKPHTEVKSSAPTEVKAADNTAKAAAGTAVVEKSVTPEKGSAVTEAGQHTSMWEKFKAAASKAFSTQKAAAEPAPENAPTKPEQKKGPEPILSGPSINC